MKEIKAYIRTYALADTVKALQEAGAPGITVVSVHPVGYGFDANYFTAGSDDLIKKYAAIAKLEIVCNDDDADRFIEIISGNSYTGTRGDGLIFVTSVEQAIKIKTGEQGASALAKNSKGGSG